MAKAIGSVSFIDYFALKLSFKETERLNTNAPGLLSLLSTLIPMPATRTSWIVWLRILWKPCTTAN